MRRAVATVVLVALVGLAGCGGRSATVQAGASNSPGVAASPSPSPSPSPIGEPRTYEALKAAVDKIVAAAAAGDGGTQWDMLTSAGKAAMTRADYVKVMNGCPGFGVGVVESVALDAGGNTGTVKYSEDGDEYEWSMVYEGGHWLHQPSDGALKWMKLGADKALAFLKQPPSAC